MRFARAHKPHDRTLRAVGLRQAGGAMLMGRQWAVCSDASGKGHDYSLAELQCSFSRLMIFRK